jgi:hypothetical protein
MQGFSRISPTAEELSKALNFIQLALTWLKQQLSRTLTTEKSLLNSDQSHE